MVKTNEFGQGFSWIDTEHSLWVSGLYPLKNSSVRTLNSGGTPFLLSLMVPTTVILFSNKNLAKGTDV